MSATTPVRHDQFQTKLARLPKNVSWPRLKEGVQSINAASLSSRCLGYQHYVASSDAAEPPVCCACCPAPDLVVPLSAGLYPCILTLTDSNALETDLAWAGACTHPPDGFIDNVEHDKLALVTPTSRRLRTSSPAWKAMLRGTLLRPAGSSAWALACASCTMPAHPPRFARRGVTHCRSTSRGTCRHRQSSLGATGRQRANAPQGGSCLCLHCADHLTQARLLQDTGMYGQC